MVDLGNDQSQPFEDLYRLVCDRDASLAEKIERAIEIGRDRLGVAHGHVTYTGDGAYEVVDTNVTTGEFTPGSVSTLETTWCRHVVANGAMVAFGDVDETEYRDDVAREATGLVCYIGAPLVVDGETYGTLCYSDTETREEFAEQERRFVDLLAQWISYELERTKHHRELQAQNERLDEFTGIVAHDLRNPLAGAMGYTELALDNATGEQREFLQTVNASLERMQSLIEGLLLLARQGTDVGERSPVSLDVVARDAWETVPNDGATLTIETTQTVYADESRLRQLLENLFRNAVQHSPAGVTVVVTATEDGFAVEDDGPGLPPGVEAAVFSPETDTRALGLGLLIVERIVSGHDWRGDVNSSDAGTRFEITGVETA